MTPLKQRFLQEALRVGALKFGRFTLKSGRESPYFFNAGSFHTGGQLALLGECYAEILVQSGWQFELLFGPAYKGIPLVSATAIALSRVGHDVPYSFNRKQLKTYGEGGNIVGAPLKGRVVIIDDVMTAGTAVRESIQLIHQAGAEVVGACVLLDRQERAPDSDYSAVQSIEKEYGFSVNALLTLDEVIQAVSAESSQGLVLHDLLAYREQYGILAQ